MALGFNFRYYIVSLSFLPFILNQTTDSEMFYCVDWNCEEFISRGKTLLNYMGKTDRHLSFRQNEDIKILGKPVDINGPDWVGLVRKKVGLVPKTMVREDQLGRRSSGFKYPLNLLPIWNDVQGAVEDIRGDNEVNTTIETKDISKTDAAKVADKVSPTPEEKIEIDRPNSTIENQTSLDEIVPEEPPTTESSIDFTDNISNPTAAEITTEAPNQTAEPKLPLPISNDDVSLVEHVPDVSEDADVDVSNVPDLSENIDVISKVDESNIVTATESVNIVPDEPTTENSTPTYSVPDSFEIPASEVITGDSPEKSKADDGAIDMTTSAFQAESCSADDAHCEQTTVRSEGYDHDQPTIMEADQYRISKTDTAAEVVDEAPLVAEEKIEIEPPSTINPITEEHTELNEIVPDEPSSTKSSIEVTDTISTPTTAEFSKEITTEAPNQTDIDTESPVQLSSDDVSPVENVPDLIVDGKNVDESNVATATEESVNITPKESTSTESITPIPDSFEIPSSEIITGELPLPEKSKAVDIFMKTSASQAESADEALCEQTPTHSEELGHDYDHHDHHHHHYQESNDKKDTSSSFIVIAKHLSSTLLSFLPEHLQDTILDVDDALVFTGIIALTLVSICVPYFLIEGFFSVRPLKKKVVELNKSLWKVSTAYENQQEEFEHYKKKALAYDEDKKRVEQLEYELVLLKKLEGKQKEQVVKYQKELKNHKELTVDMQSFLDKEVEKKKKIMEEKEKLKTTAASLKEALRRTVDDLQDSQTQSSTAVMELELEKQTNETLNMKCGILDREVSELKNKLLVEVDRRRGADNERNELEKLKSALENELTSLKQICQKYEDTVSALNTDISNKENELFALQETLGEDSPLLDIAEMRGSLLNAEELVSTLQNRLETTTLENTSLSRNLKDATSLLSSVQKEKDETANRLAVLEAWFKEKEEDLRKAVERYESEKNIRGKDKDELVQMLEDKGEENRLLHGQLEEFKIEFEETKLQHRNEIRALETKSHEHWLSLCQAERKAQDSRKEAEMLRQKLTAVTREKESEGVNGDASTAMYPLITPDMVPIPLPDDIIPSYFGLGDGFMPPPPLPLDDDREVHRPAPIGRVSPTYSDLEDPMLSPIRSGGGRDFSDGHSSASDSPRRPSPRGWTSQRDRDRQRELEERHRRTGPVNTSSPIQGFNL